MGAHSYFALPLTRLASLGTLSPQGGEGKIESFRVPRATGWPAQHNNPRGCTPPLRCARRERNTHSSRLANRDVDRWCAEIPMRNTCGTFDKPVPSESRRAHAVLRTAASWPPASWRVSEEEYAAAPCRGSQRPGARGASRRLGMAIVARERTFSSPSSCSISIASAERIGCWARACRERTGLVVRHLSIPNRFRQPPLLPVERFSPSALNERPAAVMPFCEPPTVRPRPLVVADAIDPSDEMVSTITAPDAPRRGDRASLTY